MTNTTRRITEGWVPAFQFICSLVDLGSWPLCGARMKFDSCFTKFCVLYGHFCATRSSEANLNLAVVSSWQLFCEVKETQGSYHASHCGNCRYQKHSHSFAAV
jgi:hypothetical protein